MVDNRRFFQNVVVVFVHINGHERRLGGVNLLLALVVVFVGRQDDMPALKFLVGLLLESLFDLRAAAIRKQRLQLPRRPLAFAVDLVDLAFCVLSPDHIT